MKLFFIDGQKKGDSFELSPPGASIGRELDNSIILEGEGESRYHAKLEAEGNDWKIKDLGSTNGTKHNGTKLTPNEFAVLKEGDTIVIGKQTMLFAEKLPEKTDDIIPASTKEDEKKEDSAVPSIIAIKPPSPSEDTISDADPVSKNDIDEKSSKSFSDFFGDKNEDRKEKNESSFSESTDFFGKTKQNLPEMTKEGNKRHAGFLFYIAVVGVAIIGVGAFIIYDKESGKVTPSNTIPQVKAKTGSPLLIRYEKQVTTTDPKLNIFRFLMEIKNGKVTITIDDVQSKYKEKLSRIVGEEDINELEDKIRETDFMVTEQPQIGVITGNKDKTQILTIAYGKEMNTVKVKNSPPPRAFVEATTFLEDFSSDVLQIPPVSKTPEERKQAGLSAYIKAKQHFDNYQAKEENLRIAIQFYNIAIENLRGFQFLKEYDQSIEDKNDALRILEKEIKQHFANARILNQNRQFKQMRTQLLAIMSKLEPGHSDYNKAKTVLIEIEKKINKKKRNK